MKLNENESIIGKSCILVPYCSKHVNKYNEWMQNKELLKATSSEPLTLEEEYIMQQNWQNDPDKLTFIILDKCSFESSDVNDISSMAGDINAFLYQQFDEKKEIVFEISVMVAEQKYQRRGIAKEACLLIINYILRRINWNANFIAKISKDNNPSINLFKNKLGFEEESFSQVFQLFTFKLKNCKATKIIEEGKELNIVPYF